MVRNVNDNLWDLIIGWNEALCSSLGHNSPSRHGRYVAIKRDVELAAKTGKDILSIGMKLLRLG